MCACVCVLRVNVRECVVACVLSVLEVRVKFKLTFGAWQNSRVPNQMGSFFKPNVWRVEFKNSFSGSDNVENVHTFVHVANF